VLFSVSFVGLQAWQWLTLLLAAGFGWLVSRGLARVIDRVLRNFARRTAARWDDEVVEAVDGPIGFLLWAGGMILASRWIGLTPDVQPVEHAIGKLLALVGVGWLMLRLVDATAVYLTRSAGAVNPVGVGFVPVTTRLAKVTVGLLFALAALDVIGVQVLAILTGLGLGGLAIAFAAQKTLENVFGTIAIAGDRLFQVGDYVTIGQDSGTIEDIGFRSTRLRTLARTVVSIPNGLVVAGRLENFTERDRILYNPTLKLAFSTTREQLTRILEDVRRLIESHEMVHPEGRRVRLRGFGESSFLVEVFCWVSTRDWERYLAVAEDLNLGVMAVVELAGASLAVPAGLLLGSGEAPRSGPDKPARP
jgi:MscS family membrane protein